MKIKWISIKDRLPPKDKDFIIGNFKNHPPFIAVAWYSETHNIYKYTGGNVFFIDHQTHWMSLPEQPGDGEE